jgi:GntR family transcriptional repressor for pyruvate dehydrogenase complex
MEVTSLREPKMADRVATVLRRMFIRGEITEGTMLPPESELMERFGVSRPTLREAFRVLESESLIQVQRGVRGGARVTRPRRETLARYAGLILEYEGVKVKDVYDARATLEVPMVEQLAKDRDPKVIAELEQMHHIIEKANRSLQPTKGVRAEQAVRRSAKTHRMVLDMIKAGDAEKAGELWKRHLQKAEEFVLTGSEMSTVVDLLE